MKALIRDWLLQSPAGTRIIACYSRFIIWRNAREARHHEAHQRRYAPRLTVLLKQDILAARGPDGARRALRIMAQADREARQWWTAVCGIALVVMVGCSSSPTAPSPVTVTPPPVVVVPPVVTPPVVTPPPVAFPPTDARFDLSFYRMFVHDSLERLDVLRRQAVAPRIYLRTVHANGTPIDALTLNQTAAALINTTGSLTGVFGLAGLEQGTGTMAGVPGWITVSWKDDPERRFCGFSVYGGDWIDLYTNTPGCRCAGGPAVRLRTVKHELGHALGFRHTSHPSDLMSTGSTACDQDPSEREKYHAAVAYTRPNGSPAP